MKIQRRAPNSSRDAEALQAHGVGPHQADTSHDLPVSLPPRRPVPPGNPRRVGRSPQNTQRLGRLRHELAKISPAPCSIEEARTEIVGALARAGLSDWNVPDLTDEKVLRCAEGSVQIPLLSHVLLINPTGAFRIVDLLPGQAVYFDMPGQDGTPFTVPPDALKTV